MSKTPPADLLIDAGLSPKMCEVLAIMLECYPRPVAKKRLVELLYEDDADGGPLHSESMVRRYMRELRNRLPPHGWTVSRNGGGSGWAAAYRLIPLM